MSIFISHSSALSYWRDARRVISIELGLPCDGEVASSPIFAHASTREVARRFAAFVPNCDSFDAEELGRMGCGEPPYEMLVASPDSRRWSSDLVCRTCGMGIPRGAFCRASKDVYVSSPEFVFLQMASVMPFLELVRLGYELCGTYAMPSGDHRHAVYNCPGIPVHSIVRTLSSADGYSGVKAARRALSRVVGGSNSPMETATSMLLTLPSIDGGFGLPAPRLNRRFDDEPGHYYVLDLFWPSAMLALEYDGEVHASSEQRHRDAARRARLGRSGVTVVTMTKRQLYSYEGMVCIAEIVARATGRTWRRSSSATESRRRLLLEELLTGR